MDAKIIKIENLFFDPNNYRLRSNSSYKHVDKKSELKPAIQKRTFNLVSGKNNFLIQDLIESMKANGFLKVDNILARAHSYDKSKYVVIEGNRRLAALQVLREQNEKDYDIGKFDKSIFNNGIEVVVYKYTDELNYLILMGLKHVSGNKKWDTYNQAKLLHELKEKGYSVLDIAKKIGIMKSRVEQQIRGYVANEDFINEIKSENYGERFDPYEKHMIFVELTNKPKLKKWIGWDEKYLTFNNWENKTRVYSWIKPKVEYDDESGEPVLEEPIIKSHKEVRQLEEIIDDEESLQCMEQNRNLELALSQNKSFTKKKFSKTIKEIERILSNIPHGATLSISAEDKKLLRNIQRIVANFLNK